MISAVMSMQRFPSSPRAVRLRSSISYKGNGTQTSRDSMMFDEKVIMQDLNNRMASYLDKVRSLEAANRKIELQIKEWCENQTTFPIRDVTQYYSTIDQLREQINVCVMENSALMLQLDNTAVAAGDFRKKFEAEMSMCSSLGVDLTAMHELLNMIQLACKDLSTHWLEEDLAFLKKNHKEDIHLLRTKLDGTLNVQVDCSTSVALDEELQKIRTQYETLTNNYHADAENWFQNKARQWKSEVTSINGEDKTSHIKVNELQKTFQEKKTDLETLLIMNEVMEKNVAEVEGCYNDQLSALQLRINLLLEKLQDLQANMNMQSTMYQYLLDVKMRLQQEIAEYRRLLGGQTEGTVVNSTTVMDTVNQTVEIKEDVTVEEQVPHIQRRVKVIVEKLVDGEVVSVEMDERVEEMQN